MSYFLPNIFTPNYFTPDYFPFSAAGPVQPVILPDYNVDFDVAQTTFLLGENVGMAWKLSRVDGGLVPIPDVASIVFVTATGLGGPITISQLYYSNSVPSASLRIGGILPLTQKGLWRGNLVATLDAGGGPKQVRSDPQLILVK